MANSYNIIDIWTNHYYAGCTLNQEYRWNRFFLLVDGRGGSNGNCLDIFNVFLVIWLFCCFNIFLVYFVDCSTYNRRFSLLSTRPHTSLYLFFLTSLTYSGDTRSDALYRSDSTDLFFCYLKNPIGNLSLLILMDFCSDCPALEYRLHLIDQHC